MEIFEKRLQKLEKELRSLYFSLYDSEESYNELINSMREAYRVRKPELKEQDLVREKNPKWFLDERMFGMTMYPTHFADGINGIREHLDYLSNLGITYLHLMPLLKMPYPDNDGGYAIEDFRQVDPKIGTNEELEALADELRARGISLCLDFVMNHTADTHEWAMRAKAGEKEYQDYYYCYDTREIPDKFEQNLHEILPADAPGNFVYSEEMGKWVMSCFYPFQWDLNYHNPKVMQERIETALFLANLGADAIRLDAATGIWKDTDNYTNTLEPVYTIIRIMHIAAELVCPSLIFKGEVLVVPWQVPNFFGTPDHQRCQLLYGANGMANLWNALATQDTRMMKILMDQFHSLPDNCNFVNYIRCHDDLGWALDPEVERSLLMDPQLHKEFLYHFYEGSIPGSWSRGSLFNYDPVTRDARSNGRAASLCGIETALEAHDEQKIQAGISRLLLLNAAGMSFRGFLMIYSGDEVAQLNDYTFEKDPQLAKENRNIHRNPFDWDWAAKRTEPGTIQQKVYDGMRRMAAIRKQHPCFGADAYVSTWDARILPGRKGYDPETPWIQPVFAIYREYNGETDSENSRENNVDCSSVNGRDNHAGNIREKMYCLSNFADREVEVQLPTVTGVWQDLFTGETIDPDRIYMAPWQYRWIILR